MAASKLYVGGLPYKWTDEDLAKLFESFGKVESSAIIMDKFSNRSKGFGFVELESKEDADAAIAKLHDSELDGRKITVDHARPPRENNRDGGGRDGGSRDSGGGGGGGYNRY